MKNDPLFEEFKRLGESLVKKGFAKSFVHYDDPKRTCQLLLTPDGAKLKNLLWKLFDVPKVNPKDLTPDDIADIIFLILDSEDLSQRN